MKFRRGMAAALFAAAAMTFSPVLSFAQDGKITADTVSADVLEKAADIGNEAAKAVPDGSYVGSAGLTITEAMQNIISTSMANGTDMSWLESAGADFSESSNDQGGVDGELTFSLNDTGLYHVSFSVEPDTKKVYLVCPELKKEPVVLSFSGAQKSAQQQVTKLTKPEQLKKYAEAASQVQDFLASVSKKEIGADLERYSAILTSYIEEGQSVLPVTAGSLTAEANAVTFTCREDSAGELIQELLNALSEDPIVEKACGSDLSTTVLKLLGMPDGQEISGDKLYGLFQSFVKSAAKSDFLKTVPGLSVTVGMDRDSMPVEFDAALLTKGMKVGLFSIRCLVQDGRHAFQADLGQMLQEQAGISGVLLEGGTEDGILNETFSILNDNMPVWSTSIEDLDLAQLKKGKLSGTYVLPVGNTEWKLNFKADDEGAQTVELLQDDTLLATLSLKLNKSEDVKLDKIDKDSAFEISDRSSMYQYIKDAHLSSMFEKLEDAGVPANLVEKLTDGEAGTEASRENKIEGEEVQDGQ